MIILELSSFVTVSYSLQHCCLFKHGILGKLQTFGVDEICLFGNSDDLNIKRYYADSPDHKGVSEGLEAAVVMYKLEIATKMSAQAAQVEAISNVSYFFTIDYSLNIFLQELVTTSVDSPNDVLVASNENAAIDSQGSEQPSGVDGERLHKSIRGRKPKIFVREETTRASSRISVQTKVVPPEIWETGEASCGNLKPRFSRLSKAVLLAQDKATKKEMTNRIKEEKLASEKAAKEALKVEKDHQAAIKKEVEKAIKKTTTAVTKEHSRVTKIESEKKDQEIRRLEDIVHKQEQRLSKFQEVIIVLRLSSGFQFSLFAAGSRTCRSHQVVYLIIKTKIVFFSLGRETNSIATNPFVVNVFRK